MRFSPRVLTIGIALMSCGRELVELAPSSRLLSTNETPTDEATPPAEPAEPSPSPVVLEPEPENRLVPPQGSSAGLNEHPRGVLPGAFVADTPLPGPTVTRKPQGCEKADFLFVVDNSSRSMNHAQGVLVSSFPKFMQALESQLEFPDLHVMAVDTDGDRIDADDFPLSEQDCDDALGAGRRTDLEGESCGLAGESRFISDPQEDLAGTFSCVATAGDSGRNFERPIEAALNAVSKPFNAAGGCNDGFVRDDAVLVVFFVTDEDDEYSSGDPEDWTQELLAAKYGQAEAIVPVVLTGRPDRRSEPSAACDEADINPDAAPRLHELAKNFETGVVGDICESDYSQFFIDTVVTTISWTCSRFEPPDLP